jgi:hypothetical protein
MMNFKNLILIIIAFCIPFTGNSQKSESNVKVKVKIKGIVTNIENKPVSGVQIFVDSIYTNCITDDLGKYTIKVNQGAKKIFASSTKYGFCESDINGRTIIDLKLNSRINDLPFFAKEINIQLAKKTPKVKKINTYIDIYQMIRQELPGVVVSGRSIMVQGQNSFLGSSQPLFVVNGNIVNSIDYINPQEVKSIKLLKGSYANIYGVEGANGVISITLITGADK